MDIKIPLVIALVLASLPSIFCSLGNKCFQTNNLENMEQGIQLSVDPFSIYQADGPLDCVRQCKLHALCQSVNFVTSSLECRLNSAVDGNFIPHQSNVYIDVRSWTQELLDHCNHHDCLNNTLCQIDGTSYKCITIGCVGNPSVENINVSSFISKPLWHFNETVPYPCQAGFYPSVNVTCTQEGGWNTFTCEAFHNCNDILRCNLAAPKGEYMISIAAINNTWIKLFCRFENGHSFLTVHNRNFASTPHYTKDPSSCNKIESSSPKDNGMGYTDFHKIRYLQGNSDININRRKYSNSTFSGQRYGTASDCYTEDYNSSSCGVTGYFIINLHGTGLRVRSDVKWVAWGVNGTIANITRMDGGLIVEGFCGGNCGGCEPSGNLFLEPDPNFIPEMELASECRFIV